MFPDAAPAADAPVAYVDIPDEEVPAEAERYAHSSEAVRHRPFTANVEAALELLDTYSTRRAVITSRLHCYLPVRAIGVDVEFRPRNRSDIRFDGLIDIDDDAFAAIRDGLDDKLEQVLGAVLAGRPEAEVYALWREQTAADVAAAERRRHEGAALPAVDAGAATRDAVARTAAHGQPAAGAIHCAAIVHPGDGASLAVLVASLLEHASRPLHVWLLAHPGTGAVAQRLADRFPQVTASRVPVRGLGADDTIRLLAGELLPDVERLVTLPLPAVATADVAELADLDLGGHALAAPTRPGTADVSGFGVIHAAATRLGDRTDASAALRRTAHARHRFDFDAFETGVLVLELERMRRERFAAQGLALAEAYGLDGDEALHYLVGPDRTVVPERWATVPTRMPVRGAGLIHWADGVKPSQPELTPERERWRRYAAAVRSA